MHIGAACTLPAALTCLVAALCPLPCCSKGSLTAGPHCCARNLHFRRGTTDFDVWKQVRCAVLRLLNVGVAHVCCLLLPARLPQLLPALAPHVLRCCLQIPPPLPRLSMPSNAPYCASPQIFQCHYLRYLYALFDDGEPPKYILDAGQPLLGCTSSTASRLKVALDALCRNLPSF